MKNLGIFYSNINIMRFKLKVKFHEKQSTNAVYNIGKELNFSNLPENVQKKFLDIFANSRRWYQQYGCRL